MDKILNPKQYISDDKLLLLPIITHKGETYRVWNKDNSYRIPRGCQCFGDCNCAEDAGKWVEKNNTYFRNTKFDGTDKAFYTDINYIPVRYK